LGNFSVQAGANTKATHIIQPTYGTLPHPQYHLPPKILCNLSPTDGIPNQNLVEPMSLNKD